MRPRIIASLMGGLGNQMFQYAAMRSLAIRTGRELILDHTYLRLDRQRSFRLDAFKLPFFSPPAVDQFLYRILRCGPLWNRIYSGMTLPIPGQPRMVIEGHRRYTEEQLALPGSVIAQGYWQNERYFADMPDAVRQWFTFDCHIADRNSIDVRAMQHDDSVAVHVRRGDYMIEPWRSAHGVLGDGYYRKAASYILAKCPSARFYVFSDDSNLNPREVGLTRNVEVVSTKDNKEDVDDLYMMSQCKHFIVANSTFSWWGAWLGSYHHKMVVAPDQWYLAGPEAYSSIVPQEWMRAPSCWDL